MYQKNRLVLILFIFSCFYFLRDYMSLIFIHKDNNLSTLNIHYESDYQKLKQEYETLLGFKELYNENIISKVIMRDPLLFFDELTILKGTNDGIAIGDTVFNEKGLIGTIKKVYKNTAIVELITNKDTNLSVKVGNSYGILVSVGGVLKIKNLTSINDVLLQSDVRVSPYSYLENDILIGSVSEIESDSTNLSFDVVVNPSVDFNDINYVVIKRGILNE